MIRFEEVSKFYRTPGGRKAILDRVSLEIPLGEHIGVLGMNGAGKTTLLRLISGAEGVDSGRIRCQGRMSFPIGFTGTFQPQFTARENVAFLARIYGMNIAETVEWVEDFAELGDYFNMPVGTYSSGMFAKIAFGTSFAFDFDIYLVDEAIEVGDARFRQKCAMAFNARLSNATLLLVSHNIHTIRQFCRTAGVMNAGAFHLFDSVDEAITEYERLLRTKVH